MADTVTPIGSSAPALLSSSPTVPNIPFTVPTIPTTAPVTTLSGSDAEKHVNSVIAPVIATGNKSIVDQKTQKDAAAAVANNAAPKTQQQQDTDSGFHNPYGYDPSTGARLNNPNTGESTQKSDIQTVADTPETGYKFAYQNDGTRVEIPVSSTAQQYGLAESAPNQLSSAGGISQAVPLDNGSQIAKLGNGTYATLDGSGKVTGTLTAAEYTQQMAGSNVYQKQIETQAKNDISSKMEQITNGTMPLSPWQQDQVNNIKTEYASLIAKQTIANANLEGGTRTYEGLLGLSQYSPGVAMGEIKQVVDDGIAKIASLQSKMSSDISKMTIAFQQQNFDNLKSLYDEHQKNVEEAQNSIDKIQDRIIAAKKNQQDYDLKVSEDKQAKEDKAAQLEFDKVKQDDTKSYQQKEQELQKMQISETKRHDMATELEAEKKRLADAAGSSFDPNTPFANTITNAVSLVPQNQKAGVQTALADAAKRKDWTQVQTLLRNAMVNNLPTAQDKNSFTNAESTLGFLTQMESDIKQYQNIGGDMGYLKGNAADITAKLGQLTTDPKYRELATSMQHNFVQFRNQMTGAAFSPAESKGYAALVPTEDKNVDLNLATIAGGKSFAQNQMKTVAGNNLGEGYANVVGLKQTEDTIMNYGNAHPDAQPKILQMQADGISIDKIRDAFGL